MDRKFLYYTKTEFDGCICIVRGSGKTDRANVSYVERKELPAPGFRDCQPFRVKTGLLLVTLGRTRSHTRGGDHACP